MSNFWLGFEFSAGVLGFLLALFIGAVFVIFVGCFVAEIHKHVRGR